MPSAVLTTHTEGRVAKRQKLSVNDESKQSPSTRPGSRIFAPFRTVGLVSSTPVPFTSIPLGKTTFQITTSVGQSLQTYDLRRGLNLVFLSRPQTPAQITATASWKDRVFAAYGCEEREQDVRVWVFKRGKKIDELAEPEGRTEVIKSLLVFGSWIVGCCSTRIEVWKSSTYEHYTTLSLQSSGSKHDFDLFTGVACTLPTYLNKIFVARQNGCVEIWNLSTGKLIYTILPPTSDAGAVSALETAPALSLLAIAYRGGPLIIHDVRTDLTVVTLDTGTGRRGVISSISFRTDGLGAGDDGRGAGVMATAGAESGDITFWDLNKGGRVMGVLRGAHNPPSAEAKAVGGGINKVEFLSGQPVVVSSGLDNALKTWIFDETPFSPIPRILHSRSGHAARVTKVDFLPSDADGADSGGKWLLSAGEDRSLWAWSLRRDGQSAELSQGNIRKKARKMGILANGSTNEPSASLEDLKAPAITCMATSLNRDGGMGASAGDHAVWQNTRAGHTNKKSTDASSSSLTGWESVVTGHEGDKLARTWFWGRKKAGRWALETGDGGEVKSVAITPCGTFALIGSSLGCIDMFNLQSGLHRRRFPTKLTPAQARDLQTRQRRTEETSLVAQGGLREFSRGQGKHTKAVTGLMVDSVNRTVISSGLDGKVKFWDFLTGDLMHEIDWSLNTAILGSRFHRSSDLIALSCSDLAIRVIDIETRKLVRELWGCVGNVNDFCFSNDGRWIVATSMDLMIRVWDLPTGHLIDVIQFQSVCTTLAFSCTGEYLATAHEDGVGVNIWNNRTLFTHVPTRHITEAAIAKMASARVFEEDNQGIIEAAFEDEEEDDLLPEDAGGRLDQLSAEMTTLSLVPRSRWQTLLHIDLIKQRNRPKEPPKAPEKAPFFLPSLEAAKPPTTKPSEAELQLAVAEQSRIMKSNRNGAEGTFTKLLRDSSREDNHGFIDHLKTLPPAAADLEIRSLSPLASNGHSSELVLFVTALTARLRLKQDYELVQAWMAVFLRLHGELVSEDAELSDALREWRDEQEQEAKRLGGLMGYCTGVVSFLRSSR